MYAGHFSKVGDFMVFSIGLGDVLAGISDMISKIVSVFTLLIHFITSGLSFLWDSSKWLFSMLSYVPSYVSGAIMLSICIAIVLLILGR